MPRKKPPFDLGLIPTVPEDGVQILEEQIQIPDDANVITAQDVTIIDPENHFIGEDGVPIAPLAEQHLTSASERRESRGIADTSIISGTLIIIGAVVGTGIGVAVETLQRVDDSKEYKSDEYKDDLVDSSVSYGAVGAGVGGSLGLMTSLVLSRCVSDFGDFNEHIRNHVSQGIRENQQAMRENLQQMREGWQQFTQLFSGNRTTGEHETSSNSPNSQSGDVELGSEQIKGQHGAFAYSPRANASLPQGFSQRQNVEGVKAALAKRYESPQREQRPPQAPDNESLDKKPAAKESKRIENHDTSLAVANMPMDKGDDNRSTSFKGSTQQVNLSILKKPPPVASLRDSNEEEKEEEKAPEIENNYELPSNVESNYPEKGFRGKESYRKEENQTPNITVKKSSERDSDDDFSVSSTKSTKWRDNYSKSSPDSNKKR